MTNVRINAPTVVGGKDVATETISLIDYQLIKMVQGDVGSTTPITKTAPLPIAQIPISINALLIWRTDTALVTNAPVKSTAGILQGIIGRLDSTAPNGTYYLQILNATSLPANGSVTHLVAPIKFIHTSGIDQPFSFDYTVLCIAATTGIVLALSTTEFTLTISGAYLSLTVGYL